MMSLHYDVDEEKDIDSQAGPLSVWSLHALPMSLWVSPHNPWICMLGELVCLNCVSLSVSGKVGSCLSPRAAGTGYSHLRP